MVTLTSSEAWRQQYLSHIYSSGWRAMRQHLMERRGGRCERCHDIAPLSLHHKDYRSLGNERAQDVELLCADCHRIADEERAAEGQRRTREAIRVTAINTYGVKRFGPDWRNHHDPEWVGQEFDQWLRRKQGANNG